MPDSSLTGSLRNVARSATAPVRGYFNQHFEQVKSEIRNQKPELDDDSQAWKRVADLENQLAEMALHQSQVLARLADRVEATNDRVAELERLVERLADVIAAQTVAAQVGQQIEQPADRS